MRYHALVCDYDGTLAQEGRVPPETLAALERLKSSGRRLILVTGRELEGLAQSFSRLSLFDRVVVENGAVLYRPATREEKLLCEKPPQEFIDALRRQGISPLSVGRAIVATWEPHETAVVKTLHELGLEWHVIFNKGAVMALPSSVNKASGLRAALYELGISAHNTVGVGDAENDHAFLSLCECSVAVANALPMIQKRADWITQGENGAGTAELIQALLEDDLRRVEPRLERHQILLGHGKDGGEVHLAPYGANVLLSGTSGSGKSTLATGFLERLAEQKYQFCIIDPEGDYDNFPGAVVLGNKDRSPRVEEVLELLEKSLQNAVVSLLGLSLGDRPRFFESLFPRLQELRARTGRPHWIVLDETHPLFPTTWDPTALTVPQELHGLFLITVHPDHVSRAILKTVDTIIAIGNEPEQALRTFSETLGQPPPPAPAGPLPLGEALAWFWKTPGSPFPFRSVPPRLERRRHLRKYAEGELDPDKSFYFRGPAGKLNLRTQNLMIFLQLSDGVDDETWLYHLRRGDFSRWLRDCIKDPVLAEEVARAERAESPPPESRRTVRAAIEERYTVPA